MNSVISEDGFLGGGWGGSGIGFMLIAVFLVVLFGVFRRDRGEGGLENIMAAAAPFLANRNDSPADMIAISRQANFEDPALARLTREQAVDTGELKNRIDVQTCELGRQIEQVRFDGARETCEIIRNQDRLAAENERLVLQGRIDFERDRVGELRLALAEKEARILHQETLNAIGRSDCQLNGRIDQLGGVLDHRLTRIEDKMLKKPPFFAAGGVPLVSGVIPTGFRGFPPFAEAVV